MRKTNLLIAEDNWEAYQVCAEFFEEKGFNILRSDPEDYIDTVAKAQAICELHEPDIALLDVELRDTEEDGIDLALWLKQQFNVPVIFLSGRGDNFVNLQRLKGNNDFHYFKKSTSDEKLNELWFTVQLLMLTSAQAHNQTRGIWFQGKSLPRHILEDPHCNLENFKEKTGNPRERQRLFRFDDIQEIQVAEKRWGANKLIVYPVDNSMCYLVEGSLKKIEKEVPYEFIKITGSQIVNGNLITEHKSRSDDFYIGENKYTLSREKEIRDLAKRKLNRITGRKENSKETN